MIDWKSEVGKKETFSESLQDVRHAYPEYNWMKPRALDPYDKVVLRGLRKDAESHGFTVIRESQRRKLAHAAKHGSHHNPKAKDTVHGRIVFVHEANRKWPKKRKSTVKKKLPSRSRKRVIKTRRRR